MFHNLDVDYLLYQCLHIYYTLFRIKNKYHRDKLFNTFKAVSSVFCLSFNSLLNNL